MSARSVPISGENIRLGQFLKLANAIDSGADAKTLLGEDRVEVNGAVETRRGRQLARGDAGVVAGLELTVGCRPASARRRGRRALQHQVGEQRVGGLPGVGD